MKKIFILLALLPVAAFAQHKKKGPSTYDLLIGTYTKGTSQGIYVYRFYAETGKLAALNSITGVSNPSYLCASADNKFVYSVNENTKGEVSAFSFDANTGEMKLLNTQPSMGADPCYISIDKDQKHVFVANYTSGSLAVFPVNKDGSLGAASQVIQNTGSGPVKDRQEGPHVHSAVLSPNEKYLLSGDLGTDRVNIYRYKASKDPSLTPATPAFASVKPGNGPRHMAFSVDGKYLYLAQEISGTVNAYKYDDGKLQEIQSVSSAPPTAKGKIDAADIHVSPDSSYLYVSNRGEVNNITTFKINKADGTLTYFNSFPSMGTTPRNFTVDPAGNFLLVANQNSNNINVYRINKKTGNIIGIVTRINMGNPVCLKLVPAQ